MLLQGSDDAVRLKAPAAQVAVEAAEFGPVSNLLAPAKTLRQRRFEQSIAVDLSKGVVHRTPGDAACDTRLFESPADVKRAAASHRRFSSRDGCGDAHVVKGSLVTQAGHGRVDCLSLVALAGEALTRLGLRQLAACEKVQRGSVRARDVLAVRVHEVA